MMTCCIAQVSVVYAGSWVQPKGKALYITTYRFYQAQSFYDVERHKRGKNGRFTKNELQLYQEYGWRDNVTFGRQVAISHQRDVQRDPFARTVQDRERITDFRGITEAELFASVQLWHDDHWAVALHPRIGLAPYFFDDPPSDLVTDNYAFQMAASVGHNLTLWGTQGHFVDASAAYRHRTGRLGDQYMLHAVAGLRLDEDWMVMPEVQFTGAVQPIERNIMTITGQNDYELTKVQGTLRYQCTPSIALQAGGFAHLDGINTGGGGGALLSVWVNW